MSVRFDANASPHLPWKFYPEHPTDTVSIGARDMAIFIAENNSSQPVVGTASFNVTPTQAGQYFTKIQCFCFTQQRLEPGQQMRMPVLFFVDPKIKDDPRSEEHTSELQSLMRISYAVFCLKKKTNKHKPRQTKTRASNK